MGSILRHRAVDDRDHCPAHDLHAGGQVLQRKFTRGAPPSYPCCTTVITSALPTRLLGARRSLPPSPGPTFVSPTSPAGARHCPRTCTQGSSTGSSPQE